MNPEAYLKLRATVLDIAYDNGCVHRSRTEQDVINDVFDAFAVSFDPSELKRVDTYLCSLTEEQRLELATGEQLEPLNELEELVERVLNHAFENM